MNCESVLTILIGISGFIKLIRELMLLAQTEFGAGTGEQKKAAVLDGLSAIVGNDDVWAKVRSMFGIVVDCLAIFKPK